MLLIGGKEGGDIVNIPVYVLSHLGQSGNLFLLFMLCQSRILH